MRDPTDKFQLHVRHFSELLIQLRTELGNNLDLVLILAVISERHYAKLTRPNAASIALENSQATYNINALSIAQYTRIPRETVRRKVRLLVKKGWVNCDERGNLSPTDRAKGDLATGTAATFKYLREVARGE